MEIDGKTILLLGGSGLVGMAVGRRLLPLGPRKIVISSLTEDEADRAVGELRDRPDAAGVEFAAEWGDLFVRRHHRGRSRAEIRSDPELQAELIEDLFGPLDEAAYGRSALVSLLEEHAPDIVIDGINTATVIAYQDLFRSAQAIRELAAAGPVPAQAVSDHLATLYLPQLIRHVQFMLEGLSRARTTSYVKIGTSGTGGMGLNVPFTHSEERPSRTLLAKASLAGAHSMLLFLMARTPGAPAIAEIKPSAAIAWKRIGFGPISRGGRPLTRSDAAEAVRPESAFGDRVVWRDLDEPLESVFLDAGENGMFALSEFETISALGLMEMVTPEEIADAVVREVRGRPTGLNVVDALDASAMGPTYRGGILRNAALERMEALEKEHGVRSIAFEMLGPPRLNKLLLEAHLLELECGTVSAAAELDPERIASAIAARVREDERLRTDILSVGIPILMPDGTLMRGRSVKIAPGPNDEVDTDRLADLGWVDLRSSAWTLWRDRIQTIARAREAEPAIDLGSRSDGDARSRSERIRPGALAAAVLLEEGGHRLKR